MKNIRSHHRKAKKLEIHIKRMNIWWPVAAVFTCWYWSSLRPPRLWMSVIITPGLKCRTPSGLRAVSYLFSFRHRSSAASGDDGRMDEAGTETESAEAGKGKTPQTVGRDREDAVRLNLPWPLLMVTCPFWWIWKSGCIQDWNNYLVSEPIIPNFWIINNYLISEPIIPNFRIIKEMLEILSGF